MTHSIHTTSYSRKRLVLFLGTACLLSAGVHANDDFPSLKVHWNLDEGRDWHNMAYPFSDAVKTAADSVGKNDLTLNAKLDPVKSWASGRQFSGIRFSEPGQLLNAKKPLEELKNNLTLSYWIKTDAKGSDDAETMPGIIGDTAGAQFGCLTGDGKLAVILNGKTVVSTDQPVNDNEWHHIVILRSAQDGKVAIYLDGELSGSATGETGAIPGDYTGFGAIKGGGSFKGILDQIHVFDRVAGTDTIKTLLTNHAPKAYDQDTLISSKAPSLTTSMLHLYTFDPDQDKLIVSRHGQGKYGSVKYNNNGTFTYTPGNGFKGRDSFRVTVTDRKGGFSTAYANVHDETTVPKPPVTKFTAYQELPGISGGNRETGSRIPRIFDVNADGKPDIIVCGNGLVWFHKNTGTKNAPKFDTPAPLNDAEDKQIEGSSIALLPRQGSKQQPELVVRSKEGILRTFTRKPGDKFAGTGTIKNDSDEDFICTSDAFDIGDFDNDGLPDLLVGDGGNGIYFHKNTGNASATKLKSDREHVVEGSYNLGPYFADINGDGKTDLLHGINWGSIHYWLNNSGKTIIDGSKKDDIMVTDKAGNTPKTGDNTMLRAMNGTHGSIADINGDGIPDLVIGSYNGATLGIAYGVSPNAASRNLGFIEQIYKGHNNDLGKVLEANDQALLQRYKNLNREWIMWAIGLPSVENRERAYGMLKQHVARFPFLKRGTVDAWVKHEEGKVVDIGPMHHVPGIFTMNWVTLHCMKPDSAAHRLDVANTLGLKGLDRDQYLKSGVALADNNKCTDGQLLAITDMMKYHPRVLFPDDHLSIDQNFGDGRDAMSYVFESNKNTFGNDVGGAACESARDLVEAAEKYLGKGSATGDYFTFVMAHEVCHSLDAYVYRRTNQDIAKRWSEMIVYAANNGGAVDLFVPREDGWYDLEKTQASFIEKNLWDGTTPWNQAWDDYWDTCGYKDLSFMRGNIGWFLGAKQETLATQANHHWAGSEARLVGAIDRFNRGYKSNITEVIFFLDVLSAGLNEIPMYNFETTQNPNRVVFNVDKAWLERNDNGHITRVTIGERVYDFEIDDRAKVISIKSHPFMKQMAQDASGR